MQDREELEKSGDFDAIGHQVQCDVNFLENRLKLMKAQHNPNQPVIKTYEDMLRSRLEVLRRLREEYGINQHSETG